MDEAKRKARNQQRLGELFPTFRRRVAQAIKDLEDQGVRPRIRDAWRSPEDQLKAFENGHSQRNFGFHNVTGADGTKDSLAVDLLDDNAPLKPSPRYVLRLASAAHKQDLQTRILFGLPKTLRDGVEAALAEENFDAPVKIGWDPTQAEPVGITVAEAKAGKRPA